MANCGSVPIRRGYLIWEDTFPNFLGVRCGTFPGFRDPVRRINVVFSSLCSVREGSHCRITGGYVGYTYSDNAEETHPIISGFGVVVFWGLWFR